MSNPERPFANASGTCKAPDLPQSALVKDAQEITHQQDDQHRAEADPSAPAITPAAVTEISATEAKNQNQNDDEYEHSLPPSFQSEPAFTPQLLQFQASAPGRVHRTANDTGSSRFAGLPCWPRPCPLAPRRHARSGNTPPGGDG